MPIRHPTSRTRVGAASSAPRARDASAAPDRVDALDSSKAPMARAATLDEAAAYTRALRALGQRAMSSAQVATRLARAGAPPDVVSRVVDRLVRERWVSDADVAASIARRGIVDHGWSDRRILLAMRRAGIPQALASDAIARAAEEHPAARADKLDRLTDRKWAALHRRTGLDPRAARQRLVAWLARRGVASSEIRRQVDRVVRRDPSG